MRFPFREGSFDLLSNRQVRAMIMWHGFPYIFQALLLALFITLIALGFDDFAPESVNDKLYAKTNLVTLLVWGVWWPVMVWLAVLLGRAWCMICPLELVSNLSERLGRRLGIRQFTLAGWLQAGVLILIIYAGIQMLIAGAHLHRVPAYTAIFLIFLLTLAVVTGLLIRDRAFCRGFCAVGLLLNVYGRGGMLAVRPASRQTCSECDEQGCMLEAMRHRLDARSCPTRLHPPTLNSSRDCLVCTQCIKSCQPQNMQLLLRTPFYSTNTREPLASWTITLFIMLLSGFVMYELCTEWSAAKSIFLWPVKEMTTWLGTPDLSGWIKGIWTLMIFPLLLWTLLGGVSMLFGAGKGLTHTWRQMALSIVPIIAAGHMAKGAAKLTSWGGFLPGALREPSGHETIMTLTANAQLLPGPWLAMNGVAMIGIALVVAASMFAIREAKLTFAGQYATLIPPQWMLAGLFLFIIAGWWLSAG